jgi:capsular polysaccharide biosynthesis protein
VIVALAISRVIVALAISRAIAPSRYRARSHVLVERRALSPPTVFLLPAG